MQRQWLIMLSAVDGALPRADCRVFMETQKEFVKIFHEIWKEVGQPKID